ncbi:MAG: hypothetical protein NZ772_07645, partial [Cyanobacteria bacterium]|nr:hypothetical protein [Cyanobacteriota bacterium]MDW8201384.1 hypothetical protein [Cyanobacteriota bacterium SKYGB_h_bin112]
MKFQRSTLVLLLIAVLLSGVVFVSEFLGKPQQEAQRAQQQQIFTFKEADVTSVRILTDAKAIEVVRKSPKAATPSPTPAAEASPKNPTAAEPSPKSPESPQWQLLQPVNTPGNDATVAYLLSLLTTSQYDRTLT